MKTPERNSDLRHAETGLDDSVRFAAAQELRRIMQIEYLGDRYALSKKLAPVKGVYNPLTGAKLG